MPITDLAMNKTLEKEVALPKMATGAMGNDEGAWLSVKCQRNKMTALYMYSNTH